MTRNRKRHTKVKNTQSNINRLGVPGGRERINETEEIFEEVMAKYFPKIMKDIKLKIQ